MKNLTFEKFVTNKSLNNNSIAKYFAKNTVVLVHEIKQSEINRVEFSQIEYDEYLKNIGDDIDTLAFMLDDLFNCNMLS